jgi:tetratricopeptide (TPR) repeat protein
VVSPFLVLASAWLVLAADPAAGVRAASPLLPGGVPVAEGPFRDLSLDAAFEAAQAEGKPLVVVLLETGCGPCDALDRFVFPDEAVTAWLRDEVVAVRRVDDVTAAERLEVPRVPVLVLASAQGQELDRIDRYLEPAELLAEAREILAGGGPVGRLRQAVAAAPTDPDARLELATTLLRKGRRRAALEPFLWLFDRMRSDVAWRENRLEVVLRMLGALRRDLPQAEAALRERLEAASTVVRGPHDESADAAALEQAAYDLVVLNEALGQGEQTLTLWDELRARGDASPVVTRTLLDREVQILLVDAGRFSDLLEGLGDPIVALQADLDRFQLIKAEAGTRPVDRAYVVNQRSALVETAGRYYHALLEVDRESDAGTLVELLLGLEPEVESFLALMEAALRAGRDDLARVLAERGLATLAPGPDRQTLNRFVRRVLREDR